VTLKIFIQFSLIFITTTVTLKIFIGVQEELVSLFTYKSSPQWP